jgi:L-ribulose-5-phosphate 3-epimerase UlaE
LVGFCIDSANSLRNWESAAQVFDLLEPRALQFHMKDYTVTGTNVGFTVTGTPLGEGDLDLAFCARRILARHTAPRVFLENWVPSSGDAEADIAADNEWLVRSLERGRSVLA